MRDTLLAGLIHTHSPSLEKRDKGEHGASGYARRVAYPPDMASLRLILPIQSVVMLKWLHKSFVRVYSERR